MTLNMLKVLVGINYLDHYMWHALVSRLEQQMFKSEGYYCCNDIGFSYPKSCYNLSYTISRFHQSMETKWEYMTSFIRGASIIRCIYTPDISIHHQGMFLATNKTKTEPSLISPPFLDNKILQHPGNKVLLNSCRHIFSLQYLCSV